MFTVPALPYAFDALEPYIDAKTMELHHDKHHQAYVDNLNKAVAQEPSLQSWSLEELIVDINKVPEEVRTTVRNNGGGDFNHSFFWTLMKKNGGGNPRGMIAQEIGKTFGDFAAYQEKFNNAAKSVFGSGWAWLCINKAGALEIVTTPNQDCPLMLGLQPVMGLDVWEHAYYLKYQNRRPDYITAWWHVVDWDRVEENYRGIVKK